MVNHKLEDISWSNLDENNVRIYHGVMVSAMFIPNNFKGCTPYIIIKNPDCNSSPALDNEYFFKKVPGGPEKIAEEIEKALTAKDLFISSYYMYPIQLSIHNVKLFLGYRLGAVFQVMPEAEDDETIDRLEKLAKDIKTKSQELQRSYK